MTTTNYSNSNEQGMNTNVENLNHLEMNINNENLECQDKVLAEQGAVAESTKETFKTVSVSTTKDLNVSEALLYNALQEKGLLTTDIIGSTSYSKGVRNWMLKIAFIEGNRDISKSHVSGLIKSASKSSGKKFSNPALACMASSILAANEAEPDEAKRIHLVDIDGNEITSETPEIEFYIVVLEGQHRTVACASENAIDLDITIMRCPVSVKGIRQFILDLNSEQKGWSMTDLMESNAKIGNSDGVLNEYVTNLRKILGVSPKYAMALLKFKKDAFKKADFMNGTEGTLTDVEKHRGDVLGKALAYLICEKKYTFFRHIEFLEWIFDYYIANETKDFVENVSSFLTNLSGMEFSLFAEYVKTKNYGKGSQYFADKFKKFLTEHSTELDEQNLMLEQSEKAWNEREKAAEKEKVKKGNPKAILTALQKDAEDKAKREVNKKLKEAAAAAAKKAKSGETPVSNKTI